MLRRLLVLAFWGAMLFAYVAALLPSEEAPSISGWDKMNHMIAFFVLTLLGRLAYPALRIRSLVVGLALFAVVIELSQAVPIIHRDADVMDVVADMAAVLLALLIAWPITSWLTWRSRQP